jgi:D-sedoheptulose 7-phosphate isomerase
MFTDKYMAEVVEIASSISVNKIEDMVQLFQHTRNKMGRVFVIGLGGSAANASHMANDLQKLCDIQTICPSDNVAMLTATANDSGLSKIFSQYLAKMRVDERDILFVLSVGGGSKARAISLSLIEAIDCALARGATIMGIVGRPDGYVVEKGHCVIVVPAFESRRVTPHAEEFQAIVWHCLVSHPDLQVNNTTW